MKRVGLFLVSLSMIFLLTGCGKEKKLDCNVSLDQNGVSVKQNFLYNFESNGKFKSAVLTQEAVVSDEVLKVQSLDDYKKSFEQIIKTQYKNLDKIDYNISTEGNNKVIMKVNFKDISSVGALSGKSAKASKKDFENVKKAYETTDYTCKVVEK